MPRDDRRTFPFPMGDASHRSSSRIRPPMIRSEQDAAEGFAPTAALGARGTAPADTDTTTLVVRAQAGDPTALAELVRLYGRRITGFVRLIIRQPDAVEDVTQIVFIKMFRRLASLRDPSVFEAWLFTLARNCGFDFLRARRCRPVLIAFDAGMNQIADPDRPGSTREILASLDRALMQLHPIDRTLITQVVAGERYEDIAHRTGLSLASVKVRLHRARHLLRASMADACPAPSSGSHR